MGWLGENQDDLMCFAHSMGARVFLNAPLPPVGDWGNETKVQEWIEGHVQQALRTHADGTNFDFEDVLPALSPQVSQLTNLVARTKQEFNRRIPFFQVSVDVAWSPAGIDGRWYDYKGLADASDFLFVMSYDLQSQMWARCIAQANAPLGQVRHGLEEYLALGIPADKMILGVPWYGYRYACEGTNLSPHEELCAIKDVVPFRDCSCSDASGAQIPLSDIEHINFTTPRKWDRFSQTPYRNTVDAQGQFYQVDTNQTLKNGPCVDLNHLLKCACCLVHSILYIVYYICILYYISYIIYYISYIIYGFHLYDINYGCLSFSGVGAFSQVWYDDVESLTLKYRLASELGLRGVGPWSFDMVNPSTTGPLAPEEKQAMWDALGEFTGRKSGEKIGEKRTGRTWM
jgi:di-N-acetylchitobiase